MKSLSSLVCLILLGVFVNVCEAASSDKYPNIPWSLLPRVLMLDDTQKDALFEQLKVESNFGACKDSIFDCLNRAQPDKTALRIANFGAYVLTKGVPAMALGVFIKERETFANTQPVPVGSFTFKETPSMGNEHAKITIVEFAEFKCHYCVAMGPILKKLVEESNGTVRLRFKHFPLKSHPGTVLASKAAQAAYRQGKFWEMNELLFRNMNNQNIEDLMRYAQELGLDLEKFKRDFEDGKLLQMIERDYIEGVRAKVAGTPTLFINGKFYNMRHDEGYLKDVINEEAERLGTNPPFKDWAYP